MRCHGYDYLPFVFLLCFLDSPAFVRKVAESLCAGLAAWSSAVASCSNLCRTHIEFRAQGLRGAGFRVCGLCMRSLGQSRSNRQHEGQVCGIALTPAVGRDTRLAPEESWDVLPTSHIPVDVLWNGRRMRRLRLEHRSRNFTGNSYTSQGRNFLDIPITFAMLKHGRHHLCKTQVGRPGFWVLGYRNLIPVPRLPYIPPCLRTHGMNTPLEHAE